MTRARVALELAAVTFAVFAAYALWFPFAIDYGEGPLLDQARRVLHHEWLYRADWNHWPYVIDNYPPIYPALTAAIAFLVGKPLIAGRLVSIIATVVCALLIHDIAKRAWKSSKSGIFAAAVFLGHVFVVEWGTLARVDLLALAFALAAIAFAVRDRLVLAGALALAAIFTRQTFALAAPLAIVALLATSSRRRAAAFAFALAAAAIACAALLNRLTAGGFAFHVVAANVNHYQLLRVPEFGARLVIASAPALLLIAATRPSPDDARDRSMLRAYTLGALAVALTVGKVGSWHNYFLELIAAIALWSGGALAPSLDGKRARRAAPLVIAQLAWATLSTGALVAWKLSVGFQARAGWAQIAAQVQSADGPVLADDAMTMLAASDRAIAFQPFELRQLQTTGRFDPRPIVDALAAHRIALVVLRWPESPRCRERWGPEILDAVHASYRESIRAGNLVSYVPR